MLERLLTLKLKAIQDPSSGKAGGVDVSLSISRLNIVKNCQAWFFYCLLVEDIRAYRMVIIE